MSVWTDWAAAQRAARGLSEAQTLLLTIMAGKVYGSGEVRAGVRELAERFGRSPRTTERRLCELERAGCFVTRRQGSGVAVRLLNGGVVPERQVRESGQTDLFSEGPNNGLLDRHLGVADRGGSASVADGGSATPWGGGSYPPSQGVAGEVNCVKEEEGTREETPVDLGLADTLEPVLEVLRSAPNVDVEPLSVNAILLGHPEAKGYDHRQGALVVASWAHEGGLWARAANRLLQRALLKQLEGGTRRANHIPSPSPRPARRHGSTVERGDELLAGLFRRTS